MSAMCDVFDGIGLLDVVHMTGPITNRAASRKIDDGGWLIGALCDAVTAGGRATFLTGGTNPVAGRSAGGTDAGWYERR